jgi:DNA replication initiation complex subunit (GINS family)
VYNELYGAWQLELETSQLGSLPSDFYSRLAEYLRKIKEERKLTDQPGLKTTLLEHEGANAARIAKELVEMRYRKILKMFAAGRSVPLEFLTAEETTLYGGVAPSADAFDKFAKGLLQGQLVRIAVEAPQVQAEPPMVHKRVTVRFLKPVPSIIGSDMKSYGPFLVEDVASVPVENAKILVKQELAKTVEFE